MRSWSGAPRRGWCPYAKNTETRALSRRLRAQRVAVCRREAGPLWEPAVGPLGVGCSASTRNTRCPAAPAWRALCGPRGSASMMTAHCTLLLRFKGKVLGSESGSWTEPGPPCVPQFPLCPVGRDGGLWSPPLLKLRVWDRGAERALACSQEAAAPLCVFQDRPAPSPSRSGSLRADPPTHPVRPGFR